MNASKYDSDMRHETRLAEKDIVFFNSKKPPFKLYGAYNAGTDEDFMRMNPEKAENISEAIGKLHRLTSGIRIRFKTDSPYVAISVKYPFVDMGGHMSPLVISGFDMYTVENGNHSYANFRDFIPPPACCIEDNRFESIHRFKTAEMRDIIINFPLYNPVSELYIGIKEGSTITAGGSYKNEGKPIVYYGSSILQGGCASRPGMCYPAILSRKLDCDFISLSFSGNGRAEPEMAEYIAHLEMSCFFCEDPDGVPLESLKERLDFMVAAVRKNHPDVPIILLSPTPRLELDYSAYAPRQQIIKAVCSKHENTHYIDGIEIIEKAGWDDCLSDGVHFNDVGFMAMANGVYPTLKKVLGL